MGVLNREAKIKCKHSPCQELDREEFKAYFYASKEMKENIYKVHLDEIKSTLLSPLSLPWLFVLS